ncbi:aryl sulfotransferase, partial [Salmonella enterica subsp. enterica serovar Kentucky]|nr:aryl sulfotransferase [Salmonella enterica subsp. enterica serovar Kentucky]
TTSGVIAVDKESGKVIWHAGPEVVAQQHTPVEMENGSILVFDNGNLRPGVTSPHSTVLEFDPQTKAITWQYRDIFPPAFFSPYMGSAQRLANGNTFICESAFGRLFEVTPEGETVWEYIIPFFNEYPEHLSKGIIPGKQNSAFRAHRYAADAISWLK